jgi:hypothetical protein
MVGELEAVFVGKPSRAFDKPKSSTFTFPSGVIFTLAGFRLDA